MDLRETGCEDGRWMEMAQDHVQWQALSTVLTFRFYSQLVKGKVAPVLN